MEAIGNEEYKPLGHLAMLRDTWDDEIPKEIIHSDSEIKSKVRTNWFMGVVFDVANALDGGELNTTEAKAAAKEILDRFTSEKFKERQLTTSENIQEANGLIDIILNRGK